MSNLMKMGREVHGLRRGREGCARKRKDVLSGELGIGRQGRVEEERKEVGKKRERKLGRRGA